MKLEATRCEGLGGVVVAAPHTLAACGGATRVYGEQLAAADLPAAAAAFARCCGIAACPHRLCS